MHIIRLVQILAGVVILSACSYGQAQEAATPSADDLFDAYLNEDRALIEQYRQSDEDALLDELFHRVERDQLIRQLILSLLDTPGAGPDEAQLTWMRIVTRMQRIDRDNADWMEGVLEDVYWFTIPEYGEEADNAAFLLVQHATHDPELMQEVLSRFETLTLERDIASDNYALLTDRIAVMNGQPQPYGSQWECAEGEYRPQTPLLDEANIDALRAQYNLPPLADYMSVLPEC